MCVISFQVKNAYGKIIESDVIQSTVLSEPVYSVSV